MAKALPPAPIPTVYSQTAAVRYGFDSYRNVDVGLLVHSGLELVPARLDQCSPLACVPHVDARAAAAPHLGEGPQLTQVMKSSVIALDRLAASRSSLANCTMPRRKRTATPGPPAGHYAVKVLSVLVECKRSSVTYLKSLQDLRGVPINEHPTEPRMLRHTACCFCAWWRCGDSPRMAWGEPEGGPVWCLASHQCLGGFVPQCGKCCYLSVK